MHGSLQARPDTPAQPVMCSRTGPGTALDSHVSTPAPRSQRGWAPGTGSALAGMEMQGCLLPGGGRCRGAEHRDEAEHARHAYEGAGGPARLLARLGEDTVQDPRAWRGETSRGERQG